MHRNTVCACVFLWGGVWEKIDTSTLSHFYIAQQRKKTHKHITFSHLNTRSGTHRVKYDQNIGSLGKRDSILPQNRTESRTGLIFETKSHFVTKCSSRGRAENHSYSMSKESDRVGKKSLIKILISHVATDNHHNVM